MANQNEKKTNVRQAMREHGRRILALALAALMVLGAVAGILIYFLH